MDINITASLRRAEFKEIGAGLFQHNLGVIVCLYDKPEIIVDGVTESADDWAVNQLNNASFGEDLIRWVEDHRRASARQRGSCDGLEEQDTEPQQDGLAEQDGEADGLQGNPALRAKLRAGESIIRRVRGSSLMRRGIKPGDNMLFAPVHAHDDIQKGDIVFCQTTNGRWWCHVVKKKAWVGGSVGYEYTISNASGHENGVSNLEHIYGRLIAHGTSQSLQGLLG